MKNVLKSSVIYILISVINFVIYIFTYPETILFERYPNVFYIGTILNIMISIAGYSVAGKFMQVSGKKIKDLVSMSIPAIVGSTFLIIVIVSGTSINRYIILCMLLSNISCGFIINVCMEYFIPFAFIISFLPTVIMYLVSQARHKNG